MKKLLLLLHCSMALICASMSFGLFLLSLHCLLRKLCVQIKKRGDTVMVVAVVVVVVVPLH